MSGDVGAEEPGCACGGMAACLQCQDRDALGAEVAADLCREAHPHRWVPGTVNWPCFGCQDVAPLIAQRVEAAKAEAWTEGYSDGLDYMSLSHTLRQVEPENPHRAEPGPRP